MEETSSPRSPASSLEDDNDDVNTASARVYFGPLQSPEKKFATHSGIRTPVRRSTRLSQLSARPPSADSMGSRSHAEDREGSNGLADVQISDDEQVRVPFPWQVVPAPSGSVFLDVDQSVGATAEDTRLVPETARASGVEHEQSTLFDTADQERPQDGAEHEDRPSREGTPVPDDFQDEPPSQLASRIIRAHDNPSPPPVSPALEKFNGLASSRPNSPSLEGNTSGQDLIDFDSFTIPAASSLPPFSDLSVSPRVRPTTVDDLLASSPEISCLAQSVPLEMATTSSVADEEENQVLFELSCDRIEPILIPEVVPDSPTPAVRSGQPRTRRSPSPIDADPDLENPGPLPALSTLVEEQQATANYGRDSIALTARTEIPRNTQDIGQLLAELAATPPEALEPGEGYEAVPGSNPAIDHERTSPRRSPRKTTTPSFGRELGSLSPGSANTLAQLLPSVRSKDPSPIPEITIQTPTHSPKMPLGDLPSEASDERSGRAPPMTPGRTPARRVPMSQAVIEGLVSPQKGGFSSGGIFSKFAGAAGPSSAVPSSPFKRAALDDPTRSPAKRIPILDALAVTPGKGKAPARAMSPLRVFSKEPPSLRVRSASADPTPMTGTIPTFGRRKIILKPPAVGLGAKRAGSEPPVNMAASVPLPFPITTVRPQPSQPSIPEVDEDNQTGVAAGADAVPSASSPAKNAPRAATSSASPARASPSAKSNLRQPTASSRIPRVGAKPYARPKPAAATSAVATARSSAAPRSEPNAPTVMRRAVGAPAKPTTAVTSTPSTTATLAPRPMRIAQGRAAVTNGAKPAKPANTASSHKPSSTVTRAASSSSSPLKRKREDPKIVTSGEPVVLIRKVVPGMFGNRSPPSPSAKPADKAPASAAPPSPAKAIGPVRMRRVVDWKKPATDSPAIVSQNKEEAQNRVERAGPPAPLAEYATKAEAEAEVSSSLPQPGPSTNPPTTPPRSDADNTRPTTSTEQSPGAIGTRRSTRSRRSDEITSDVFGTDTQTTARPLQPRKKRPAPEVTVYQGMSAVALRALTLSNTTRNQQQVAAIEKEIIHKDGPRPESPTSRARTALEKAKELKAQERRDRAARRAKRLGGAEADGDDAGNASMLSEDGDSAPLKHRRGPGDEEDYETPERPERPLKRGRIEGSEMPKEKHVKWDRGLAVTFYLDDTPPKPRRPPDGEPLTKGCLTPAAKTVRLDTLGNALNADVPVDGIVQESVVIKKFVYEDDPPAVEEPPQTPPPAASKTRSKGKKAKA